MAPSIIYVCTRIALRETQDNGGPQKEFGEKGIRAVARAVELDGRNGIYYALVTLGLLPGKKALPGGLKAFGIVGFFGLLSSHPSIEKRLRHIEKVAEKLSRKKR